MLPFNYGPALNLNLKAKEEQNWPTGLKRDVGRQRLDNVCGDRKQPELKPEVDERRKDELKSLSNVLEFSFRKLQLQSLCCVPSFRSESVIRCASKSESGHIPNTVPRGIYGPILKQPIPNLPELQNIF